jgi:acetylornithine/succinyldiaminopimelate/putrescine aminotransferase
VKVTSSVAAAQDAVSGIAGITLDARAETAELGASNIESMKDAAVVTNTALDGIVKLSASLIVEARNVDSLAKEIEERDSLDAAMWGADS